MSALQVHVNALKNSGFNSPPIGGQDDPATLDGCDLQYLPYPKPLYTCTLVHKSLWLNFTSNLKIKIQNNVQF